MGNPSNGAGNDRLDRIEQTLARLADDHAQFQEEHKQLQEEHKHLLKAQVLMHDTLQTVIVRMGTLVDAQVQTNLRIIEIDARLVALAEAQKQASETQKHTDEKLNALIQVVDDFIRRRPPSQQ